MNVKQGLIVENLPEGGCLVLDESAGKSHALRPEAAVVWTCLTAGVDDPATISERTSLDAETVHRALIELAECDLVESAPAASRRQLLSRAATIAGAAAGLKLIESVATPTPAAAQSNVDFN
jgi:hypothetical protein